MFVNKFLLVGLSNPFLQAYRDSDLLGKGIYLGLVLLSVFCWTLFIYKTRMILAAKKHAELFQQSFKMAKGNPLSLEKNAQIEEGYNPYFAIYHLLKKQAVDLLTKNRNVFTKKQEESYLSSTDISCLDAQLISLIAKEVKKMDQYLFVLSTIVGLAPLMGLLGTVWGILISFSQMQTQAGSMSNQMVLGGIALALTTTVLGLLTAIPALIAYNYLKNLVTQFETEMEAFANQILFSIEICYRKVNVEG